MKMLKMLKMSKLSRKAQGGLVVLIIAAIAVFMLIYLFALPLEQRCKILSDLPGCKNITEEAEEEEVAISLLSKTPGLLKPREEIEYTISNIELFNKEESEFPFSLEEYTITRRWFSSKEIEQKIYLHENTIRAKLFIVIKEARGKLAVIANDKKIAVLNENGTSIIDLPLDTKKISLKASAPVFPWQTNKYELSMLVLKGVYELTQPSIERKISIEDMEDIRKAVLSFESDCYSKEPLKIVLNDKTITKEVVRGDFSQRVTDEIKEDNSLVFSSDGNYFLYDIILTITTGTKQYPIYYFSVEKEDYEKIEQGKKLAMLKFRFSSEEEKELKAYVNGNLITIETDQIEWKTAINRYLLEGQNSLKLMPVTEVEIVSLDIYLE